MLRSHQCTSQICIIGDHSPDRAKLELYPKHDRAGLAHYLYEVISVVGACITEDGLERVRSRLPCNKGCLWRSRKYQATRTLHQDLCTLKPSCTYPQNPDTAFPSPAPRLGIAAPDLGMTALISGIGIAIIGTPAARPHPPRPLPLPARFHDAQTRCTRT